MARAELDAIALLKADHRQVEELFEAFEKTKRNTAKQKIANQICLDLIVHTTIEEELFYPALTGNIEEDILQEAYVEHDGAKVLIAEVLSGHANDKFYDAKVKVLGEDIKHHVKEEEQSRGMFAQAKQSGVDLHHLADQIAERKAELIKRFKEKGVPMPETRAMKGVSLKAGHPVHTTNANNRVERHRHS